MSWYILDTDHLTLLQQRHPLVQQRVRGVDPALLAITIISAEEQMRGWLDVIRRYNGTTRQLWAYQGLRETILFFHQVLIIPFDQAAYQQFEALHQQKIRIGSQDLRIASIGLAISATIVTRNTRDFAQVPGLIIEDWSTP